MGSDTDNKQGVEMEPCSLDATLCGGPSERNCWNHAAKYGRCYRLLATDPLSVELIALGRAWRAGEVVNIGPGTTSIYLRLKEYESRAEGAMALVERMAALGGKAGPGEFADWLLGVSMVCIDARDFLAAVPVEQGETDG